jgi:hypothetical protein
LDKSVSYPVDIAKAFELPANAASKYTLESPWKADASKQKLSAAAGKIITFKLEPFEVITYEASSVK